MLKVLAAIIIRKTIREGNSGIVGLGELEVGLEVGSLVGFIVGGGLGEEPGGEDGGVWSAVAAFNEKIIVP